MKNFLFGARIWRVLLCLSYVLRVQFLTALPADTTSFDFRTIGHGAQSFQAQLHIDSLGGSMNLMPFCDQIFYGSLRDPHIVLEKSSNFLSSGCFPLRSYYCPVVPQADKNFSESCVGGVQVLQISIKWDSSD